MDRETKERLAELLALIRDEGRDMPESSCPSRSREIEKRFKELFGETDYDARRRSALRDHIKAAGSAK